MWVDGVDPFCLQSDNKETGDSRIDWFGARISQYLWQWITLIVHGYSYISILNLPNIFDTLHLVMKCLLLAELKVLNAAEPVQLVEHLPPFKLQLQLPATRSHLPRIITTIQSSVFVHLSAHGQGGLPRPRRGCLYGTVSSLVTRLQAALEGGEVCYGGAEPARCPDLLAHGGHHLQTAGHPQSALQLTEERT